MKKGLIPILICPKCKSILDQKVEKQTKNRINNGKLLCKKCNSIFRIVDDILYIKKPPKQETKPARLKNMEKIFLDQEIKKEWLKLFNAQELSYLKKEWQWIIKNLNPDKSKVHLDWATGTGRFLRNILEKVSGDIIVLDYDYPTCLGLKKLLIKINKYSSVSIIYGDARNMPFINNSIDSISSWHGLDEPQIKEALKESCRVLKPNKTFSTAGLLYNKNSESLKRAKKCKIEFAEKNKAQQYFRKIKFRNIKYEEFFKGTWNEKDSFLPIFGDQYISYGISGKKLTKN